MSNGSSQPSISPSRPVDPSLVRVLRVVSEIASALHCSFFVAGATARDLMLVNVFDLRPGRATRDIDFGIAVESWDQFDLLKQRLVRTENFTVDLKAQQRLVYTDQEFGLSIPVDFIPFQGVASADATVSWPPNRDMVLNVAGFEEAWESSIPLEIDGQFNVRVASIPGLTVLKLIAWADRSGENNKDASDLHRLLKTYADAGNVDRLYDEEAVLLETVGFDMELAGAELLGGDCARICHPETFDQLRSLLGTHRVRERLLNQMTQIASYEEAFDSTRRLLDNFCRGFIK